MRPRDTHPTLRHLADVHDGVAAGASARRTRAHLDQGCAPCRRRAARLGSVLAVFAAGAPEEPPAALTRRVLGMLRAAGFEAPAGLDAEVLVLAADSAEAGLAGVRSAPGAVRRVLYRGGADEVDLELRARVSGIDVLGQVLPTDPAAAPPRDEGVVRATVDGRRHEAPLRADGRFTLRGLSAGWLVLEIVRGGRTLVLRGAHLA